MARAVDITEENLEDLLAYDDLFLDYFNAFLSLPVFATPLYYNRLTGTFLESDGPGYNVLGAQYTSSPPYGATDEEREAMLEWAKDERLPLFLKTQLFREFKLCKLLLRPLDERYSAGRGGSSKIRGYSRQTESYVSSLSNSADNSGQDADFEDEMAGWEPTYRRSVLYRYPRPGSRAFSLPSRVGLGPYGMPSATDSEKKRGVVSKNSKETYESLKRSSHSAHLKAAENENGDLKTPKTQEKTSLTPEKFYDPIVSSSKEVTFHKEKTASSAKRVASGRTRSAKSRRIGTPKRRPSAKSQTDKENENADEVIEDFDIAFGEEEPPATAEVLVQFHDDGISDVQTEKVVERLEGKHKMPLQTMKEQVLGSVSGMEQFKDFLESTSGADLIHFWMDCEYYKDSMEEYDEEENNAQRNRLFRDIQDRYKLTLTRQARQQIQLAARDSGLSHTVFIRTQYDILRRLRMYWVSRFLIHKERIQELSSRLTDQTNFELHMQPVMLGEQLLMSRQASNFFPSISLASSMPVKAEDAMHIAKTTSWDVVCRGGKNTDSRIRSAKPNVFKKPREPSLKERLLLALIADKAAGGPFRQYLERHRQQPQKLSNLLFWQDVTEYGQAEDRSADRLLRMVHAWNIYNTYISEDSRYCIGCDAEQRDKLHTHLLQCKDLVGVDIFAEAKEHAVSLLEKSWIRYLKEDMKSYIDAHVESSDGPPTSASEYEVIIDKSDYQLNLYVKGPRPWVKSTEERYPPSTASERADRLHTALSVAESISTAKKQELKRKARERREIMEKERKKAVREARKIMKQRHQTKKSAKTVSKDTEEEEGEDGRSQAVTQTEGKTYSQSDNREKVTRAGSEEPVEKPPTFVESVKRNKNIITMLKKYIQDNESKELRDAVNMYMEVDTYQHIDKDKVNKAARDKQANLVFKNYIDTGSKKKVQFSDKVYQKMKIERDRPKTATMKECQNQVVAQLEEAFTRFWNTQQEIYGDGKNMNQMSKAELAMRSEDLSTMTNWKNKGGGGKAMRGARADGRAQPTRDDQVEFLTQLTKASLGQLPIQMLYFYKYLVKFSEDEASYVTGLDRDLFFYFEVQKFKDGSHQYADEEMLNRKVKSILECYLESNSSPALQVNVPSDIASKTTRAANKYIQGKEVSATIFDEAQYAIFKNLLPYWAGFSKTYKTPKDEKAAPLTKPQRERKKRLEEIREWKDPTTSTVSLPALPKGASVAAFTYSVADGVKWRDAQDMSLDNLNELGLDTDLGRGSTLGGRKISVIRVKRSSTNMTKDSDAGHRAVAAK